VPEAHVSESIDSHRQHVGTCDEDGNSDFLVSKGSLTLDADVPLLIYKVKQNDAGDVKAAHQMDQYIEWGCNI
jgi:hypothetical protein